MSLPVSHYEALLAEVRGLRRKAQRVQQLATPLITNNSTSGQDEYLLNRPTYKMESLLMERQQHTNNYDGVTSSAEGDTTCSEEEYGGGAQSSHMSVSSEPITHRDRDVSSLYHGTWPVEGTMWNSEPTTAFKPLIPPPNHCLQTHMQDVPSVMSFASSSGGAPLERVLDNCSSPCLSRRSSQQLEAKVDMVYSLLAMLGGQEHADMGETLLALSTNPESCIAMRQSGCIPLLVQLVQSDKDAETRLKASQALHNLVHSQPDEKLRKKEIRIFKLLEQTRAYTESLRNNRDMTNLSSSSTITDDDNDKHPIQTIAHLMKLSFDEGHRQAICQLGGIHTIANLVEAEHSHHGSTTMESHCILMRRYACMALTNLTFGDSGNKALLCSFREFMRALVVQLQNPSDELRQVTASVLRNLSWRADTTSKEILREVGSVLGLMKAAMLNNKENTLKSILSALWNLSAHCTENKSEICSVENALGFLVDMLTYKTPSKSLAIIENSGGILRNISSQIAVRDDYREILRKHNCLQILLDQLKSPSLTIVSNACGTLWNLSAKCPQDQEILWEMGAPAMLRSLNHSKHKMIAMGSSAALKNLLSARPTQSLNQPLDSTALAMDLPALPTLGVRKQKNLLQELDHTLSETYENIEKDSPIKLPLKDNKTTSQSNSDDYCNLNEPSTSFSCKKRISIPSTSSAIPETLTVQQDKSSLPCMGPKKYTSIPIIDNEEYENASFNVYSDLSLTSQQKIIKEKNVSDEKDRCSIDDSDADTQKYSDSSIDYLIRHNDDNNEIVNIATTTPLKKFEVKETLVFSLSSDEGHSKVFESTSLSQSQTQSQSSVYSLEELAEKKDVEKDKLDLIHVTGIGEFKQNDRFDENKVTRYPSTGIPLPRSSPRAIPGASTTPQKFHSENDEKLLSSNEFIEKKHRQSALPRRSLQTTTPIKIRGSSISNSSSCVSSGNKRDTSIETKKVQNIDDNVDVNINYESLSITTLKFTQQNIFDGASNNTVKNTDYFNISEENNSPPKPEMSSPSHINQIIKKENDDLIEKSDIDSRLERSCEETNQPDNRMLDPDAMIESLDRFTAELVSQASHLQKDDKYTLSSNNDNTWNEDTSSPNEITFSSVSGAPNIITFNSENNSCEVKEEEEEIQEVQSNDFSSLNTTTTLAESTLIAMEATKVATVFKNEAEMSQSITSIASLELDQIQPPSQLNSMNNSIVESNEKLKPPKIIARKKSLPSGIMVRRALNITHATSLENLESTQLLNFDRDLDGSMTSVASLPSENEKVDFVINGTVNRQNLTKFNCNYLNSVSDLENINPPSIFNEITDLCNSLADIASEAIETDIFEDCNTHIDNTHNTEEDVTEFSDANSNTPVQSDITSSSPEITPRKLKPLSKSMMTKQRRNLARDRYKTYTVAAEMVMKPETPSPSSSEIKVKNDTSESTKLTPKERRLMDRSRFETQILDTGILLQQQQQQSEVLSGSETPNQSPSRSKLSIRRNFVQKRLENKDRFKTQTLEDPKFSPEIQDIHYMVQKEANLVLKTLSETKASTDEFLDCETLSLVSNDDDSEHNSGSSGNYRTYHKSFGFRKDIPVVQPLADQINYVNNLICDQTKDEIKHQAQVEILNEHAEQEEEEDERPKTPAKPKIVKPEERLPEEEVVEEQPKAVRGRRKPLYSKTNLASKTIKPKPITSNLVKVTPSKNITTKPPPPSRASSGYSSKSSTSSSKASPVKTTNKKPVVGAKLERQGTFTKDETQAKSKIPSKIPAPKSKLPSKVPTTTEKKVPNRIYNRSTSADSRETIVMRKIQSSPSTQSLKTDTRGGAIRKSSIPPPSQRSGSNSSLNNGVGNCTNTTKKQVTSKIASLWKKIEDTKKQPPKKDTRVWIQNNANTKEETANVKSKSSGQEGGTKRLSRLGSFIVMDDESGDVAT